MSYSQGQPGSAGYSHSRVHRDPAPGQHYHDQQPYTPTFPEPTPQGQAPQGARQPAYAGPHGDWSQADDGVAGAVHRDQHGSSCQYAAPNAQQPHAPQSPTSWDDRQPAYVAAPGRWVQAGDRVAGAAHDGQQGQAYQYAESNASAVAGSFSDDEEYHHPGVVGDRHVPVPPDAAAAGFNDYLDAGAEWYGRLNTSAGNAREKTRTHKANAARTTDQLTSVLNMPLPTDRRRDAKPSSSKPSSSKPSSSKPSSSKSSSSKPSSSKPSSSKPSSSKPSSSKPPSSKDRSSNHQ